VIWVKTDAGRAEMQSRSLVKDRARRNLLLLIDGTKSEAVLLSHLTGIGPDDFQELRKLELIAPASGAVTVGDPTRSASAEARAPRPAPTPPTPPTAPDMAQFSAALTRLISSQLGLRGFTLTLAVEKAAGLDDLEAVAQRVLDQIRERKGEAAEAEARKTLYGV